MCSTFGIYKGARKTLLDAMECVPTLGADGVGGRLPAEPRALMRPPRLLAALRALRRLEALARFTLDAGLELLVWSVVADAAEEERALQVRARRCVARWGRPGGAAAEVIGTGASVGAAALCGASPVGATTR